MDFARFRLRTALLALGGLALVAVLAGGCAAPDTEDRARFTTVSGVVRDAAGNPIPGARVVVVSSDNYFGPTTFTTNAGGVFFIDPVQVRANAPAVLRLRAEAPGFVSTPIVRTGTGGAVISDITVGVDPITDLAAVLPRVGATVQVGPTGGTVTAAVTDPAVPGAQLGSVQVVIPPGALATTTAISVTPISGAALPSTPPAPGAATPVAAATVPTATTTVVRTFEAPLAAVDLQPDGLTFPANARPTVRLPLPLTPADLPAGTPIAIRRFNPDTGLWEAETTATVVIIDGRPFAEFQVSRFSLRIAVLTATGTFATLGAAEVTEEFPPLASRPGGYTLANVLPTSLELPGVPAELATLLRNAFGSVAREVPNGFVTVTVPPVTPAGVAFGQRCTRHPYGVTFAISLPNGRTITRTGTRRTWICNPFQTTPVQDLPPHLQGHLQGGGGG